jgi:preprotein translocase subunit SecG
MQTFLTIVHVFVSVLLVTVILLQAGRAGGMGVLSGAATQVVFGGRGAGGFLAKATAIFATLFMLTSASLAYSSSSARDSLQSTTPPPPPPRPATADAGARPTPTPAPAPSSSGESGAGSADAAPAASTTTDAAAAAR